MYIRIKFTINKHKQKIINLIFFLAKNFDITLIIFSVKKIILVSYVYQFN